jgi:putative PEP-CTERM system histidine kinase
MSSQTLYAVPSFLGLVLSLALAGLVLARFQRTTIHWAFAAAMVALGLAQLGNGLSFLADSPEGMLWWRRVALAGEILMSAGWLVFSLTFARSNAQALLRGWRGGLGAAGLLTATFLALSGSDGMFALVASGDSDLVYIAFGPYGVVYACLYLVLQVLILANLEQTFRHANENTRWSLKFPLFGLGLLCVYFLYQMTDLLLYRTWHPGMAWLSGMVSVVACLLIGYGFIRRPLRDVQIYVSRRILSGSLTFLIIGGSLVVTGLVAQIIRYADIPGKVSLSTLFIFISVLGLVLALSAHNVRLALGRFVERHFFPHTYDYRVHWMEVTEAIGGPGTPEQIAERVMQVLRGIWGPRTISIWVTTDWERDTWGRIGAYEVHEIPSRLDGTGQVKVWLEAQSAPLVVHTERPDSPGQERIPPVLSHFLQAERTVLVIPLKAGPQAIGWITLGPKSGGRPYDQQDLDLIRSIAAHVADRLQHLLLAEKLTMAREMEAFYEYTTFFLHDLKNFTSTLSLIVQNAERRGGDPEFQRSAMETVRATVHKMTTLIGKLTALSRDPQPKRASLDVNSITAEVLKGFDRDAGARIVCETRPVPAVEADTEQLQQVLLNLVLNAREAVGADGTITIRTKSDNATVTLSVEDNGCGMDHETIAKLFRPFRTAKGRGLGIGLYQCRKIVEAHQGRLEVDSVPGKGSRFIIRLPVFSNEGPSRG